MRWTSTADPAKFPPGAPENAVKMQPDGRRPAKRSGPGTKHNIWYRSSQNRGERFAYMGKTGDSGRSAAEDLLWNYTVHEFSLLNFLHNNFTENANLLLQSRI
jgi:hypothetical protein